MKNPKVMEAISSFRPGVSCPQCKEGILQSVSDYPMLTKDYFGHEKKHIIHAIVCDECGHAIASSSVLLEVKREDMKPVGSAEVSETGVDTFLVH